MVERNLQQQQSGVQCPYCQKSAVLVTGATVYPHHPDLHAKKFWYCEKDRAWVGCHPGGTQAMGRLADAALRSAKMAAHAVFDPRWASGSRSAAYAWLAQQMGLPQEQCHIGMFDLEQCRRVVSICRGTDPFPEVPRAAKPQKQRHGSAFKPCITKRRDFSLQMRGPDVLPWE